MRIREKLGMLPIPVWLFAMISVLYCETVFHWWITETFSIARFCTVLIFALGFGSILALIVSFLGHTIWGKWVSAVLMLLVSAMYLVEYFVSDAYVTFMTLGTLLGGAKGVFKDFGSVVLGLVMHDFWRILVMLLPVILYVLLAKPVSTPWKARGLCAALALVAYLGGFGWVNMIGADTERLSESYDFDSAIRCFGLNMGFTLDAVNRNAPKKVSTFVPVDLPQAQAPSQDSTVGEENPTEPEAPVYEPNVMDLDFAAMAKSEPDSRVANLHQYVSTLQPSMKNAYTGLFAGKNLILITAEAFSREVIDPQLTPTLYRLANSGIRFEDYYQPIWGGSTSTGEFSVLSGFIADNSGNSIKEALQQELFLSIGKQLQKQGYFSAAYHNHDYAYYERNVTHIHYGYDSFTGLNNGMEQGVAAVWPESDLEMIDFTVPQYIDQQPFSIYYMTVSGHCNYNFYGGNRMSSKNQDAVAHLDMSETMKAYYASQLELEYAMASLVRQLEEAGIADDTVIVLTADHYPYGLEDSATWGNDRDYISELYGYEPKNCVEREHNALIIWSGCIEGMDITVTDPVYSLDILPTLSNLFGVEYDSRLLIGRDVFSDSEPIVLWKNYTWRTEKGTYYAQTQTFVPAEGVQVDEAYIQRIKSIVHNKINYSTQVQSLDYFNYLWEALENGKAP